MFSLVLSLLLKQGQLKGIDGGGGGGGGGDFTREMFQEGMRKLDFDLTLTDADEILKHFDLNKDGVTAAAATYTAKREKKDKKDKKKKKEKKKKKKKRKEKSNSDSD